MSHTAFEELIPEWTPLAIEGALGDGWTEPSVRRLRVLAQVGEGHTARVVAATCTHCGARLRPEPSGGSVRCSAGGSLFRRDDGAVLEGPAKTPIPRFEVRHAGNGLEVRSIAASA